MTFFSLKRVRTTSSLPQANGMVERFQLMEGGLEDTSSVMDGHIATSDTRNTEGGLTQNTSGNGVWKNISYTIFLSPDPVVHSRPCGTASPNHSQ